MNQYRKILQLIMIEQKMLIKIKMLSTISELFLKFQLGIQVRIPKFRPHVINYNGVLAHLQGVCGSDHANWQGSSCRASIFFFLVIRLVVISLLPSKAPLLLTLLCFQVANSGR